jgi:hypothetical protein
MTHVFDQKFLSAQKMNDEHLWAAALEQNNRSPVLRFDKEALARFAQQPGGPQSSLYSALEPPSSKQEAKIPPGRKRIRIKNPPNGALAYTLLHYMEADFCLMFILPIEMLLRDIHQRCPRLLPLLKTQASALGAMLDAFAWRFVLETLARDERGSKLAEILQRLENLHTLSEAEQPAKTRGNKQQAVAALQVVKGGRANLTRSRLVWRLLSETLKVSLDPVNDKFHEECSGVRRRGRRPDRKKDQRPNAVDSVKAQYILSQRSAPPVQYCEESGDFFYLANAGSGAEDEYNPQTSQVDTYKLFVKTLTIFEQHVPHEKNHGIYLQTLLLGVERLLPVQWPMRGLVRALLNAESILPLRRIAVPSGQTFYCAYSGQKLLAGEEVWHIRVLTRSGARTKRWEMGLCGGCSRPAARNLAAEYTRSIRAFLVKLEIIAPHSLFYADFEPEYKKRYNKDLAALVNPRIAPLLQKSPAKEGHFMLPPNRAFVVSSLWIWFAELTLVVEQQQLAKMLFFEGATYEYEQARLQATFDAVRLSDGEEAFMMDCYKALLVAVVGNDARLWAENHTIAQQLEEFLSQLYDSVLDFIDLLFGFEQRPREAKSDLLVRRPIQLEKLAEKYVKKENVQEEQEMKRIKPRLSQRGHPLLLALLAASSRRDLARESPAGEAERKDRQKRLELVITKYPLVFFTLYNRIYEPATTVQTPLVGEALKRLGQLGLGVYVQ